MGKGSVGDLIPAVTKPIVASFKVRALERELDLRSEFLELIGKVVALV